MDVQLKLVDLFSVLFYCQFHILSDEGYIGEIFGFRDEVHFVLKRVEARNYAQKYVVLDHFLDVNRYQQIRDFPVLPGLVTSSCEKFVQFKNVQLP